MNVIAPKTLRAFWEKHPHAEEPLRAWIKTIQKGSFNHLHELKDVYPGADTAKSADGSKLVIFDIGGNKYRLVTYVSYRAQRVYIRSVMTHKQYNLWNKKGRPT